ncbi:MAG TPA: histidine phosphatase family protein [Bacilli bacterium]
MVIGLIRHGETDWNAEKRIQGQKDIALNENGIRQAKALAEYLRQDPWDAIVASDLTRAMTTAETIAAACGISRVYSDRRLRERYYGDIEGTTLAEREKVWGEHWRDFDHRIESDEAVRARGIVAIRDYTERLTVGRILFVSHGSLIRQVLADLLPEQEIGVIHNTSLTVLERSDGRWACKTFNCVQHLKK